MSGQKKLEELAKQLNVMDDTLFHKVVEDPEACEEILRVFLQDKELKIISSTPQKYLRNAANRSVIVDAYCEGSNEKKYVVEMQKADRDDHQRRVRYIGSNVDTRITEKGIDFKEIPDVYLIYLTKFDVFEKKKAVYHIDRTIQETGDVVDNGFYEIYINAEIDDGSDTAKLMQYIRHTEGRNETFKKLSDRVRYLKEEGSHTMCEAVEAYAREYAAEAEQRAAEAERKAAEAAAEAERKAAEAAAEAERQNAAELFKNGVSLDVVLKSLKTLDQETIREIYKEVTGD